MLSPRLFNCGNDNVEMFQCSDCDFTADIRTALRQHFQQFHILNFEQMRTETMKYSCKYCNFETYFILNWFKHVLNCLPRTWIETQKCNFSKLATNDALNISEKLNEQTPGRRFKCDKCNYIGKRKSYLKQHIFRKHLPEDEIPWFKCNKCDHKTKTKSELQSHKKYKHVKHDQIEWFKCEKCDYDCKTKGNLKQHVRKKHLKHDQIDWLKCEKCEYKCLFQKDLKRHIFNRHLKDHQIQWFKCDSCEYRGKSQGQLKQHKKNRHVADYQIQWIKCDKCDYYGKSKDNLKRHVKNRHLRVNLNAIIHQKKSQS